jgi:hypothetical protein
MEIKGKTLTVTQYQELDTTPTAILNEPIRVKRPEIV